MKASPAQPLRIAKELDDTNFLQAIRTNRFYVVDFWANWCGPCKMMLPVFDEITAACQRKDVSFAKVHVVDPKSQQIKDAMKISSLPTFIIFKDGKEVARKLGGSSRQDMIDWIDQYIGKLPK